MGKNISLGLRKLSLLFLLIRVVLRLMVVEHSRNDTDVGKPNHTEIKAHVSQRHFVYLNSRMNWPGIEARTPLCEPGPKTDEREE
jgi:hypothetical protein